MRRTALALVLAGAALLVPVAPAAACASSVCDTINVVCQKAFRIDCVA